MLQKLFPPFVIGKETGVPPNIYLGYFLGVTVLISLAAAILL